MLSWEMHASAYSQLPFSASAPPLEIQLYLGICSRGLWGSFQVITGASLLRAGL